MRIFGLEKLHEFCEKYTDCRPWIQNWLADVRSSKWSTLNELKERYPTASILSNNVVIFNVKGNKYRMAVQVAINSQVIAVKWIGTHAEYSRRSF